MPDFKATRHTFAKPAKEVIKKAKEGQLLTQMQYPSDLGQYKFLMQFSCYQKGQFLVEFAMRSILTLCVLIWLGLNHNSKDGISVKAQCFYGL